MPLGQPSAQGSVKSRLALVVMAGALAICILGLGASLWLQTRGDRGQAALPDPSAIREQPVEKTESPAVPAASESVTKAKPLNQQPSSAVPVGSQHVSTSSGQPEKTAAAATPRLQLLIPAYFYPNGLGLRSWEGLIDAASKVKIVVIANPSSGPGDQRNTEYFLILNAASEKGIQVIGYVSTGYAKYSLSNVKQQIDHWFEFYPQIKGFFFDQQSTEARDVPFYLELRDHARLKIKDALIINNPGGICDELYFAQAVADVTCIFSSFEGFDRFSPPGPFLQYPPSRFAALTYQISDSKAMRQVINDAMVKRIGYLYVSDTPKGVNPWARLPVYWNEEVEAVSQAK